MNEIEILNPYKDTLACIGYAEIENTMIYGFGSSDGKIKTEIIVKGPNGNLVSEVASEFMKVHSKEYNSIETILFHKGNKEILSLTDQEIGIFNFNLKNLKMITTPNRFVHMCILNDILIYSELVHNKTILHYLDLNNKHLIKSINSYESTKNLISLSEIDLVLVSYNEEIYSQKLEYLKKSSKEKNMEIETSSPKKKDKDNENTIVLNTISPKEKKPELFFDELGFTEHDNRTLCTTCWNKITESQETIVPCINLELHIDCANCGQIFCNTDSVNQSCEICRLKFCTLSMKNKSCLNHEKQRALNYFKSHNKEGLLFPLEDLKVYLRWEDKKQLNHYYEEFLRNYDNNFDKIFTSLKTEKNGKNIMEILTPHGKVVKITENNLVCGKCHRTCCKKFFEHAFEKYLFLVTEI